MTRIVIESICLALFLLQTMGYIQALVRLKAGHKSDWTALNSIILVVSWASFYALVRTA